MRRPHSSIAAAFVALVLCALAGAPAANAAPPPPSLQVTAANLIDAQTGQILYGFNAHSERAIASTTKLMTALITLQHVHRLSTVFRQMDWRPAAGDSQIGLAPGERMTVHDLLYALLIPSADDAAMDLAYNVGGHSVARFVRMMNVEARKLGLRDTHYSTPSGLDQPGNYSSAHDLDALARYDLAHYAFLRRVVAMPSAYVRAGDDVLHIRTTDYLLNEVPWIHGVKTGHTNEAGYVLVSEGRRDGMELIGSVLGTQSEDARDDNALALLNWGYAHFHVVTLVHRGAALAHADVEYSGNRVPVIAARTYRRVIERGAHVRVIAHLPPDPLVGPLAKGDVVGHAAVLVGARKVGTIPLVLAHAIPKASLLTRFSHKLTGATTLLVLAMIACAGAVLGVRRRAARHKRPPMARTRRIEER